MISEQRRKAFRFFLEHAGYATPPGRAACALDLARAEMKFELAQEEENASVDWFFDDIPYDHGIYSTKEIAQKFESNEWSGPFGCIVKYFDAEASLWGIVFGQRETSDPYARVVAAELAEEAISEHEKEMAEKERAEIAGIPTREER